MDDRAADGPISHMAIEGEYDRMLMERDGLNAAEQSPLPSAPANRAVWEAASPAFVHASPDQMRRAYRSMAFFSGFLARSNGRMTGKVIGAVSHMLPIPSAKGIALKETPHPSAQESNADLNRLLEAAIPETAEQITAFFQAISEETPVVRRGLHGKPAPHPPALPVAGHPIPLLNFTRAAPDLWGGRFLIGPPTGRSPGAARRYSTPH